MDGDFDFSDINLDDDSGFTNSGGSNSNGFDDSFGLGGGGSTDQGNSFTGAFDDASAFDDTVDGQQNVSKMNKAYILIAALGVAIVVVVLIIAGKFMKGKNDTPDNTSNNNNNVAQSGDVNNIMQSGKQNNANNNSNKQQNNTGNNNSGASIKYIADESSLVWMEVTDGESVEFNNSYSEMTFTITAIKHYARTVDNNNNLVLKTTLQGSISGLSGTYTIDVPYDKGTKVHVGNEFTIKVQLGTYKGKTVVGDITY